MTTVLSLEVIEDVPHRATVRFLLDGVESLREVDGHTERNRAAAVVDTDALVPRRWPHRVALYGCCCGEFGCSTLTARISVEGREVVWSQFRTVMTADFDAALPDDADPDPTDDPESFWRPLDVPEVRFAGKQYEEALAEAHRRHARKSRPRAVVRLLADRDWDGRPWQVLVPWVGVEGAGLPSNALVEDAVWVDVRGGDGWRLWAVPIPDGATEDAAQRLAVLLEVDGPSAVEGAVEVFA